jgi:hypothetical protein
MGGGRIVAKLLDGVVDTLLGAFFGAIGALLMHALHAGVWSLLGRPSRMPLDVAVIIGVVGGSVAVWMRPRVG